MLGMSLDKKLSLKGQKFIEEVTGNSRRVCGLCLYRYGQNKADISAWRGQGPNFSPDCEVIPEEGRKTPHELFGFRKKYLPQKVEGREVGNYCPYFAPLR
jgi:hypothetical protein